MVQLLLKDIPDEALVTILEFLRATDLAACSEVDKTVFHKARIQRVVRYQLQYLYSMNYAGTPMKEKRSLSFDSPKPLGRTLSFDYPTVKASRSGSEDGIMAAEYGCDMLYIREIKCILAAVQSQQPITGKGFWISTSWIANAKKYFEALSLPEILVAGGAKKSGAKKQSKIRRRRGSDALPPWPSMTADITCAHDALALTKGARAKKRLIDSRAWFFLRKFYPEGSQFKSTCAAECAVCVCEDEEAKASVSGKREAELRTRRTGFVSGPLEAVALRKSGVPSNLTTAALSHSGTPHCQRKSSPPLQISEETWLSMVSSSPQTVATDTDALFDNFLSPCKGSEKEPDGTDDQPTGQPLLPGLYNLVPKQWLKVWRQFTRDPTVTSLPPLDCTCLLCHTHGQLVIPPHFEEYIVGLKRSLLGGLGAYQGQVFEVLSADEWDALQNSLRSLSDFSVRFCLDGENLSWNIAVCTCCDPFSYGPGQTPVDGHF